MQVLSSHTIPAESRTVAALVKKYIRLADATASVILFGSRVRGDAEDDSDWDFLVLTKKQDAGVLADELRKIKLREVELKYNVAISLVVKNAILWESDYPVTNIYESITEEGVLL
jgi:uncharacterized protein